MTSKEAFDDLKQNHITLKREKYRTYKNVDNLIKRMNEKWDLLEQLVERDTPLKPEIGTNQKGRIDLVCTSCNFDAVLRENFCSHCGQRLDWGNENE